MGCWRRNLMPCMRCARINSQQSFSARLGSRRSSRALSDFLLMPPLSPPLPLAGERSMKGLWWLRTNIPLPQRLGGDVGLHLAQDLGGFRALQALDVVLVLQQHTQRVVDGLGIEVERVQLRQSRRPVDRFGDARRLEQVELAQLLDEAHDLARQPLAGAWCLDLEYLEFTLEVGI